MPVNTNAEREFNVGETVHFRVRTSPPGSKTPKDVTQVRMTSMKVTGVEALSNPLDFTRVAEGDYVLSIPTVDMAPGTYRVVAVADEGPTAVVVLTDEFVLMPI